MNSDGTVASDSEMCGIECSQSREGNMTRLVSQGAASLWKKKVRE